MEMICNSGGRTAGMAIIVFACIAAKRSMTISTLMAVLGTAAHYYSGIKDRWNSLGPSHLKTESTADSRWGSL